MCLFMRQACVFCPVKLVNGYLSSLMTGVLAQAPLSSYTVSQSFFPPSVPGSHPCSADAGQNGLFLHCLHLKFFDSLSTGIRMSFSALLRSSQSSPNGYWCMGLFPPPQDAAFPFVELHVFSGSPSLQVIEIPLNDSAAISSISDSSQFNIFFGLTSHLFVEGYQVAQT